MVNSIPEELIKKIREEVLSGKLKWQVAQELGVSYDTVKKYTRDITLDRNTKGRRSLPPYLIREIRERIQSGKSKYQVSKELGVSYSTVVRLTRDLPSNKPGFPGIRGKTLQILQRLLTDGYVVDADPERIRHLRKYFPEIRMAVIGRKHICYLDEKAKMAALAFLEMENKKVISYQELKSITKVFGVKLENEEKRQIIGRKENNLPIKNIAKKKGIMQKSKESQQRLDDFLGKFLHSELLKCVSKKLLSKKTIA